MLHSQTEHVIVLLIEFAKLSVVGVRETEAARQARAKFLIEQAQSLLLWT